MMVPANRLIAATAIAGFGAAALAAAAPGMGLPIVALLLAFALAAALDAAWSASRLDPLRVRFVETAPEGAVYRLTRGREATLPLRIETERPMDLSIRVGLALPPGCESPREAVDIRLDPAVPAAAIHWPCTPRERGRHTMDTLWLEAPSRLGLWRMRARRAAAATISVYPNTEAERRRVAALFLRRGGVGMREQRQVGKGREFEQLREYIPGDGVEDIHWKATARRAAPITKVWRVERTQEVYAVIDAARFSARPLPDGGDNHLELAMNAALVLGMAAERQGDRFGLAVFSDRLDKFVPAGHGRPHYQACREAIHTLQPRMTHPDFGEVFSALRMRLRRRALLIFLTHLDDALLAEAFATHAPLLARRHLLGVFSVTPPGVRPLFSTEAGQPAEIYTHLAGHLRWQDQRALQRDLHRHGIPMRAVPHASLTPEIVAHYLAVKRRQLL